MPRRKQVSHMAWVRADNSIANHEASREGFGLLPTVEKSPLFVGNGERVENFKALTTTTKAGDNVTLDVVTDRYSVIQNEQVFKTMSEAFKGTGLDYTLSCIGTLGGLKKFFIIHRGRRR